MLRLSTFALLAASVPAFAQEINVYSHRQPELIQPLVDAFTAETGIAVNVAFVDKGMAERLQAEGDRSPADLILTVDIARLMQIVDAGVTQAVSPTRSRPTSPPNCAIPPTTGSASPPAPASSMPRRTASSPAM